MVSVDVKHHVYLLTFCCCCCCCLFVCLFVCFCFLLGGSCGVFPCCFFPPWVIKIERGGEGAGGGTLQWVRGQNSNVTKKPSWTGDN